ncbi:MULTISPECIES: alpha-amylase family glycosyl hydrolase [Asticcacaulis]|uniref:alpha-amylase family glycosyl hydrolase n=1 Tax=Asticcacaulis TaxID=76890 RepID=UPI001FD97F7A|nr:MULTISPECIES: alpha-amylase family glycosyl hydrolase [Asticcacaulis]MBP2158774.1 oligo-1,6-glucosidase/alpha-glucosidase [Asticcacaulis solisilvae]MDR6799820.1 oligo-1,6-glucosidase/alpha-glucosidase [Asticcacaulis sp. BE141]
MNAHTSVPHATRPWWESGVVYQIYPRSFQDGNGDGVGDLEGIRQRLDHVADLGVDAIWLSPIFPSPMADFGYDVADYCGVADIFGDLDQFDALLEAVHERGLKLLLDFVPNHSSTEHPWFIESRSSRDNPKRDWYIWRDPAPDGGLPNNWTSDMGGPAWAFDAHTGQYYLHTFLTEQADLNWRNPEVRKAMTDVLRFWFDRGVDGFRIDVMWHCIKADGLPDNPVNPDFRPEMGEKFMVLQHHSANQPEVHQVAHSFRQIADEYGQRLLVGEICLPVEQLVRYYGDPDTPGVHLPFNFQLLDAPWNAQALARIITDYEAALPPGGWPNWVIGSHDAPRIAGRLGEAQARVAAMLVLTLRGTPTLYQGDELGIGRVTIPPDRIRDTQDLRQPGLGLGRDGSRTPMPWDDSLNAGFSATEPWLPLNDDWQARNVAAQGADPSSMLNFYRCLLRLRRDCKALNCGDFALLPGDHDVLTYERREDGQRLLIALNLTDQPRKLIIPADATVAERLLSTLTSIGGEGVLAPNEGVVLRLESK